MAKKRKLKRTTLMKQCISELRKGDESDEWLMKLEYHVKKMEETMKQFEKALNLLKQVSDCKVPMKKIYNKIDNFFKYGTLN